VPAELAGQRPLLERAAAGDREAFALVYDDQVEGVYRYLLAWTGDRAETAELTAQVFHAAIGWLPATTDPEGEAGAWLIAMARDATVQLPRPSRAAGPAGDVVTAVARLGEPEREVVVLRLLLGHSLDHTAHLSGYSQRAAMELQLAACLAINEQLGGPTEILGGLMPAPPPPAEEFERRLGRWEVDLTAGDPALADALAVAGSLRRATPGYVVAPPAEFVQRLRADLIAGRDPLTQGAGDPLARGAVDSHGQSPLRSRSFPHRVPQQPEVAEAAALAAGLAPGGPGSGDPDAGPGPAGSRAGGTGAGPAGTGVAGLLGRRPWVATGVATAGILVVLAFQAFGGPGGPPECDGRPCPTPTTVAAVAGGGSSLGTPLTTVLQPSTTSSTVATDALVLPPTTAPRTSPANVPPSTRPATTAPPTTAAPRPTTTTAPPTTAPPTTAAATTTTATPVPPT
jgi:DNA-directed RNA polymerase specialized sigma24 family protein